MPADELQRIALTARVGAARVGAARVGFVTPDVGAQTVEAATPIVYVHHNATPDPSDDPAFTEILS